MKQPPNKKVTYIVFGIVLVLAAALAAFWFFFYKPTITVESGISGAEIKIDGAIISSGQKIKITPGKHEISISADGYITYDKDLNLKIGQVLNFNVPLRVMPSPEKITAEKIRFGFPAANNESFFYLGGADKTIYQIKGLDKGEKKEVSAVTPNVVSDITRIIWSPERALAVLKKTTGKTLLYDFKRYDLLHQEIHDWGNDIGDLIWAPDSSKIIYYYHPVDGEETLIRANKDNTEMERIYNFKDTNISDPKLAWSADGKKVLLVAGGLYIFDIYYRSLTGISQEQVEEATFSPNSQKILYRTKTGLFLVGLDGKDKVELQANTPFSKIAWLSNDYIFASISEGGQDKLYKISLPPQEKKEYIYQADRPLKLDDLVLSADKTSLFFNYNGYLYKLLLEPKDY